MDEKYMLTATDLMNYNYCPRIIYFTHVLKKSQITTPKEYKGREKEVEFSKKGKRAKVIRKLPMLPKLFKVHLSSDELCMKTVVDSIIIDYDRNEAYPVQAKYSRKPRTIFRSQRAQLMLEAMLIEFCLGYKVPFGFIKFLRTGDLAKVYLNDTDIVIKPFKNILDIIKRELIPKPTKYTKRCIDCCFRNICR